MAADDARRQELSLRIRDDQPSWAVLSSSGLRLVGYLLDCAAPVSCGRYRRPRQLARAIGSAAPHHWWSAFTASHR